MNKYKVGDKVVFTVTGMFGDVEYQYYALNKDFSVWEKTIDKYSEPLSTYTEPLEAKIRRQAAEITRLLAENEKLKAENGNVIWEIEQAFDRGCNEAWKLARKLSRMEINDKIQEAFNLEYSFALTVIEQIAYPEAAAKVEAWEKAKEEIKVGDVVRAKLDAIFEFCVTEIDLDGLLYGIGKDGAIYSDKSPEDWEKTGRHIDIDGFLKQIRGE